MEKVNLKENLKKQSLEQTIKTFFSQIFLEEYEDLKESKISEEQKKSTIENAVTRKLNNIVVKVRFVDPRIECVHVYCVCSEKEINKLISFEEDYITVRNYVKKIKKLKIEKKLKFEIFDISYKESENIVLHIVKMGNGAEAVKDMLIAEDDLYYAKERLDHRNVKF